MISPRTVENPLLYIKYPKKGISLSYMAGRENKIHRGRLDKEILADRAQLFHPKI